MSEPKTMRCFFERDTVLELRTMAGVSIADCCWEAAEIALAEQRKVVFIHNEIRVEVDPWAITGTIVNTWEEGRQVQANLRMT